MGGIDPLLGLLVAGTTEKSHLCVAGALCALVVKHADNLAIVCKRLVGLLGSQACKAEDRAVRMLVSTCTFANDSTTNQVALAKAGCIPPLAEWLSSTDLVPQAQAARALLCVIADNTTTQVMVAKSHSIPPMIELLNHSSPEAQDAALRALWHLSSRAEHQVGG